MICSNCATENPAGSKFCKGCGARLSLACASCGAPLIADARFCNECGTPTAPGVSADPDGARPVGVVAVAATPAGAVAERRLVSVLFADLVGFTPFAEERDAEDVRDTLTRYFDLASDVITRYGGTVEKFIGDAVMAVWGAPVAREQDTERAVRAALELVDAVRALAPGMEARAAVVTGEAAVTIGATNQGMVAGDLVNTASRLQSVAPPGAVLVGEATHRVASQAIAFEEAGERVLKGKVAPVKAWRAMRVVAEEGGRNRSEGLEAPFVGRDEEFRLLKDLFHATGREKRTRLVSIIGPAGIGKSRLAWEFSKYTDGLVEDTYWHAGRSPAYGESITFWALGEMVRRRAGLLETDDEPTTRAKVTAIVREWISDEAEQRWIEPSLLALLGIEQQIGSDQLFGAWRTFFERIATRGTVAMVFEDLHWADQGTLDFIDHLLEWSKGLPIYIVTLARPEVLDKRPDWGAGTRNFTSLYLEPLPELAMRDLLVGLVPGLPESAVSAIVVRADGIPLYAVETVRMLLADGRLTAGADGTFHPVGDLTALAVPETLTALVASRLDTLEPGDRALVSDCAVLGQSFTLAGLSAVNGTGEAELEPRLRGLVRRELFTLESDPRSPERGQYAFVQALIREVAYNTLARKDRKTRHLAAARFFESLGSDELAGGLAGHYLAAHANAPEGPESDALAGQARIALKAAAERAAALGGFDQAVAFLEQALTITTDATDEADLLERAGHAASKTGQYEEAEAFLGQAEAIHRRLGDRHAAARVIAALARTRITSRRLDEALLLLEGAVSEFADLMPDPAVIALGGQLARAYYLHEEPARAVEQADRVLDAAEHADLLDVLADTLVTKGSAFCGLGRLREGVGVIEIGEHIARAQGDTATLLRGLNNRQATLWDVDPRAAVELNREGLSLARRIGDRPFLFGFVFGAGWTAFNGGDADGAMALWEGALADDPDTPDRIDMLTGVITAKAALGEPSSDQLEEIGRLVADVSDPNVTSSVLWARGWAAFCAGRYEEADRQFRLTAAELVSFGPTSLYQAARAALWGGDAEAAAADLAAIDAIGIRAPVIELRRLTIQAGLAAVDGRPAEALRLYREALRGWADFDQGLEEALVGIDMAILLDPSEPEVRAATDRAHEILTRMRARPLLERLETAMARSTEPARPSPDQPQEAARPARVVS